MEIEREFVSDLLWQVIEKVANAPTLHHVRRTFEGVHDVLLYLIMGEIEELDLEVLTAMSEELSENIFQSIASDSFQFASELHLFTSLTYPQVHRRLVRKFKRHLENPIPPEPTKTKRFFSSVRAKIKKIFFDSESLYSDENCLSDSFSESTDPKGTEPVQDGTDKRIRRGTKAERERMVRLVLWKLIGRASYRSVTTYQLKDRAQLHIRLFGVLWKELKDLDFVIFPKMDKKLSADIYQLLSGNDDIVRERLFYLMTMNDPIVDFKIVTCFKRTLAHPRKAHLRQNCLKIAWKHFRNVVCNMFCLKRVHPCSRSPEPTPSTESPTDSVDDYEGQDATESPVSEPETSELLQHNFPEPQNSSMTPVECAEHTRVESEDVVSGTFCKVHPDLAALIAVCRPIFIQVGSCKSCSGRSWKPTEHE